MGCTTGHLACPPQSQTCSGQDGQALEAGGSKVPEVLSSLERLTQATGGMEKSWYRCIFPFGIICLVIGVAGTGVTYTYNDLPQTKVVSVVLLVVGFLLLILATACWTVHKKRKRKKKEGGSLTSEQCPLWRTLGKQLQEPERRHRPKPGSSRTGFRSSTSPPPCHKLPVFFFTELDLVYTVLKSWTEESNRTGGNSDWTRWTCLASQIWLTLDGQRSITTALHTVLIVRQQVSSVKTTSDQTHTNMCCTLHAYLHTRLHAPSSLYSHKQWHSTVAARLDTQYAMQSCCWSQRWRHWPRQSQHSSYLDRWPSKRPEVGQRRQPDTQQKEQRTGVRGQRHSLVLWHRSNVLGAFFTQWQRGTWVQQDLSGICMSFEPWRLHGLSEERKVCAQVNVLVNWILFDLDFHCKRGKNVAVAVPSKKEKKISPQCL